MSLYPKRRLSLHLQSARAGHKHRIRSRAILFCQIDVVDNEIAANENSRTRRNPPRTLATPADVGIVREYTPASKSPSTYLTKAVATGTIRRQYESAATA